MLITTALVAASVVVLAGCAAGSAAGDDEDAVAVVASTNVYGQIVAAIGGDAVDVDAIIDSAAQDPHSYEASARDQLRVSRADLIVENGGGYDAFMDGLIEATGTEAPVLTAVEFSPHWPGGAAHDDSAPDDSAQDDADDGHDHVEGFNEHVWYDLDAMSDLAAGIASELGVLRPADEDSFTANLAAFQDELATVDTSLAQLATDQSGSEIFVTEPVPIYLTGAAGLVNVTPEAFSEAVEEGQDVAPATLLEALGLLRGGGVRVVIANSQTGGVETDAVIAEAEGAGIPVLEFSEVLPDGVTYVEWMAENVDALAEALAG